MTTSRLLAGIDVGGTKIAAGIVDGDGRILASRRVPTAPPGGVRVVDQIIDLLRELIPQFAPAPEAVDAIGIAVPAVIDRPGGAVLWAPNIPGWQERVPVAPPISDALGLPVSLHYDGHAWVMGEWWRGAARGAQHVALIAVGTGIGGGLLLGGRLHTGHVGVAGALGWWALDRQHAGTPSSIRGGLESIASGPAIARAAGADTAEAAFHAAREGDPTARTAVANAAHALGLAAADLASLLDPEVIVLAGGVMTGGADLLLPTIQDLVRRVSQPQVARSVRLVPAELGEDAAWLGAAKLAAERADE